ncbi:MAG: ubiquinol-cytochrome C chaperone family protein [Filomicrobium sp.]
MFAWLNNRKIVKRRAAELYDCIVLQGRSPAFYSKIGVADTLEGRFEMIVLHMFLVLNRLAKDQPETDELRRVLSEIFVTDMDDCMRELGVGDTSVPKKVKKAAIALRERYSALQVALSEGPAELADVLKPLSGREGEQDLSDEAAGRLAAYIIASEQKLAGQDLAKASGQASFGDPSEL